MKIAFDAKRAFLNTSGLGNYSRTIIRQLCHFYPENEYLLYTPGNGNIEPGFPPQNCRLILPQSRFSKVFNSWWRSYRLGTLMKESKPDIFHGLSNEIPFNIHKSGTKTIVTIHDLIFLRMPGLYKSIDRKIYRRKFEFASKNADRVIAISEQTKKDLIHFFNIQEEKISVVYQSGNPVFSQKLKTKDIDQVIEKYGLPAKFLLYVGTIEERKNLLQLIRALHRSKNDIPLVVVGRRRNEYFKQVNEEIVKLKMNNVFFPENIPTSDLPALYQGAEAFIYPSSFEGFGIPVLEAVQSGTPVIAGMGHCLEETGGPDSIYIDPFNMEDFASAIDRVLESESLRSKMINSGLKHARNFQPEKTVNVLYNLYQSLNA